MARTRDEILDLVKRLLSMTVKNGCTQAEAENAAVKVTKLLQEHKLTMSEIPTQDGQAPQPSVVKEHVETEGHGHDGDWRASTLHILAKANFCRVVKLNGQGRCCLFGDETDVLVVKELHAWVVEQLENICTAMWREYRGDDRRPTFRRCFFAAANEVIYYRLKKQAQEFVKTEACISLVLRNDKAIQAKIDENFGSVRRGGGGRASKSSDGTLAGRIAGGAVSLNNHKGIE